MSEWSGFDGDYPGSSHDAHPHNYYPENIMEPSQAQSQPTTQAQVIQQPLNRPGGTASSTTKGESPREIRNKAEKKRRDKMSQSISRLISILQPIVKAGMKLDKTSVLRLTAHYLRCYKHVFGNSTRWGPCFSAEFTRSILRTMKGFLLTATYKGVIVIVSSKVQEYLGFIELELLGHNLSKIVHPDDYRLLREQLLPKSCKFTRNGELLLSREPNAEIKAANALKNEKRSFTIRFKKFTHSRSEPVRYLTCHVEGSFRKSDCGGVYVDTMTQTRRRQRAGGKNPYDSGNDVVFIGMVRPTAETFMTESALESFRMEYRTRHSIDGGIIECEQRISLVTGYMIHEVNGVNAMNFMHRDDVRWVIIALREMYDQHRLMGESCYRLMMKNGEFVYMRTRGSLDVDPKTNVATSFVCTNTVVCEQEGIQLIRLMKNKYALMMNNEEFTEETVSPEVAEQSPVEDPRQLQKVIFHLVTDLPSPLYENVINGTNERETLSSGLAIIPPKREQIQKSIEKSYSVIKIFQKSDLKMDNFNTPTKSLQIPTGEPPIADDRDDPLAVAEREMQGSSSFNPASDPQPGTSTGYFPMVYMPINPNTEEITLNLAREHFIYQNDIIHQSESQPSESDMYTLDPLPSTSSAENATVDPSRISVQSDPDDEDIDDSDLMEVFPTEYLQDTNASANMLITCDDILNCLVIENDCNTPVADCCESVPTEKVDAGAEEGSNDPYVFKDDDEPI